MPTCSRCARTDSECIWVRPQRDSYIPVLPNVQQRTDVDVVLVPPHLPISDLPGGDVSGSFESLVGSTGYGFHSGVCLSAARSHSRYFRDSELALLDSEVLLGSTYQPTSISEVDKHTPPRHTSESTDDKPLSTNNWDRVQDYAPAITWPLDGTGIDDEFDPEGVMSIVIDTTSMAVEPVFQKINSFFLTFLSRYYYDYAAIHEVVIARMQRRCNTLDSIKYGMLGTAVLFQSNYERSRPTASLRNYAKDLYVLATRTLQLELESVWLSPWVKLSGLVELINYEYYAGNLSAYYYNLTRAASLIRGVMGNNSIDLLGITGEHTFDVRLFAWWDILSSMALSRPTLLDYDSNIQMPLQSNTLVEHRAHPDRGVEWICGCPDILTVLLARTTALRHAQTLSEDKASHGRQLEQLIRDWQFKPVGAKLSTLRVARLGAQEVWRHTAILYVHQAIFKSDSNHPTVKDSVKNIIRIASTLQPGVNPDCFLPVPYFIAGFFAVSQKDRYTLRSRILSCGNERFLRHLVVALDDLWEEADATGTLAGWSRKQPPVFTF